MQSSRINYVLVGGFVIAMVAGLVIVLTLIAGRTGPTETYHAYYGNVGGVKSGTQVFFEGYPVGTVDKVTPANGKAPADLPPDRPADRPSGPPGTDNARFRVTMALKEGWTVPEGSVARITSTGLLAGVAIEIAAGAGPGTIPPGGTIAGSDGANLYAALADAASSVARLSTDNLQPLITKLTATVDHLGGAMSRDMPEILANLRRLSEELAAATPEIAANLRTASSKLNDRLLSERNLDNFDQAIANTQTASERLIALGDNLASASDAIRRLTDRLDTLVESSSGDVRDAAKDLRYTLDSVARQIDSIMYNMDTTTRNMSEFTRSIRRNPGLLLGSEPAQDRRPLPRREAR